MSQNLTARAGAILKGSVLEPYPEYRMAIGVLGVMLPPLVVFGNWRWGVQNSISAYYYTPGRDWFVGILWVIGVFLFFYKYSPQDGGRAKSNRPIQSGSADAWLGKIAGIAAVLVALFPTYPSVGSSQPPIIGKMHGFAAFVLFAALDLHDWAYAAAAVAGAGLIIALHHDNIGRLLAGSEPKVGQGGQRRAAA